MVRKTYFDPASKRRSDGDFLKVISPSRKPKGWESRKSDYLVTYEAFATVVATEISQAVRRKYAALLTQRGNVFVLIFKPKQRVFRRQVADDGKAEKSRESLVKQVRRGLAQVTFQWNRILGSANLLQKREGFPDFELKEARASVRWVGFSGR